MPDGLANRDCSTANTARYERHRPERTLLYRLIEQHYPAFLAELEVQGHSVPKYVQQEFDDFLKCGRLEHGFLRVRCDACHAEKLVAFSCKRRGFCPSCGAKRMVESAALLVDEVLPHLPMRQFLDGAYAAASDSAAPVFHRASAPTTTQLQRLLERISRRIGRYLERQGLLVRDPKHDYLQLDALDEEGECMDTLRGHSITYRIALGRHVGKQAFTLQTLPATDAHGEEHLVKANGFSLHAGVWAGANDRAKPHAHRRSTWLDNCESSDNW